MRNAEDTNACDMTGRSDPPGLFCASITASLTERRTMAAPVRREWTQRADIHEIRVAPVPFRSRYASATVTALRMVAGLMFMQHGIQKHFGLLLAPNQPY